VSKLKISNRIKSLEEIDHINVEISGPEDGTIRVTHARHHGPEFNFRWSTDHFIGYFIDSEGNQSQAIISLYTPMDAIKFVSAYSALNDIRANQR
jgi:hypothetical protein